MCDSKRRPLILEVLLNPSNNSTVRPFRVDVKAVLIFTADFTGFWAHLLAKSESIIEEMFIYWTIQMAPDFRPRWSVGAEAALRRELVPD